MKRKKVTVKRRIIKEPAVLKTKHKSVNIAIGSNKVSKQVVQIIRAKAVPVESILDVFIEENIWIRGMAQSSYCAID